jgi:hypothetical protein
VAKPQYGAAHKRIKEQWRPAVDAGEAWCTEPLCLEDDRWIPPDTEWDLAHNRDIPGTYHGPAHARCNRSEGGKAAHAPVAITWQL